MHFFIFVNKHRECKQAHYLWNLTTSVSWVENVNTNLYFPTFRSESADSSKHEPGFKSSTHSTIPLPASERAQLPLEPDLVGTCIVARYAAPEFEVLP